MEEEAGLGRVVEGLFELIRRAGGPLGRAMRGGLLGGKRPRAPGVADHLVFPVPFLSLQLPRRGRGRERARRRRPAVLLAKLMIAVLNLLRFGGEVGANVLAQPSAPQRRVQSHLWGMALRFLRDAGRVGGEPAIRECLREPVAYHGDPRVLPLGVC